jgi:outer membrane protein TolC
MRLAAAVAAVAAVAAGAAVFAPPVMAQQRAAIPAQLTLDDAIAIARERNPEYLQAVNSYRAQGAQVRAGWGAFMPSLDLRLSFVGYDQRTVTGQDTIGRPIRIDPAISFQQSSSNQSLSAGLTLFDGLRSLHTLRAARATQGAADATRWATRSRVDAETTRRFYESLRTGQLIALEERLLASAREQRDNTDRLFRAAAANQEDVLGAEADVANAELQLARAKGDADKAVLALREQIGLTEPVAFEVVGELPATWDPTTLRADSLVALALMDHPEIARLAEAADAAHQRASSASGGRWPTVQLGASLSRSIGLQSYQALFDLNPKNRTLSFNMSVTLPLFTGFQTSARVAAADADARNADEALRAGRLGLERDVRSAVIDVQNAYQALRLAERGSALSSERLRLARERYAIGAISFANLQILIDRASQDERQLTNARYAFAEAVVALEERAGRPVRP